MGCEICPNASWGVNIVLSNDDDGGGVGDDDDTIYTVMFTYKYSCLKELKQ